ncbi:RNA polymerase sigma-70 factor [Sphingobacterium shayense]|nr:RNA polymerase sigma-70 factor [Sphingobacterium shayense]
MTNAIDLSNHTIILKELALGSQRALRTLYDLYFPMVYQLAFNIVDDEDYARQIVQDTFLKLWSVRADLNEESNIRAFIFVICRNKSFNLLKTLKRERFVFREISANDYGDFVTDNSFIEKEIEEALERVICKLPTRQQQVFRMSRIDGLTHKEISTRLSISTNTVKNHLVCALKVIRREFPMNDKFSAPFSFFILHFFFQ